MPIAKFCGWNREADHPLNREASALPDTRTALPGSNAVHGRIGADPAEKSEGPTRHRIALALYTVEQAQICIRQSVKFALHFILT
jgi:hypothetical protein